MTPTTAGYTERVIAYVRERAAGQGMGLPGESESLFKSGVIDSFALLEFVAFMEEELKIEIPDEDLLAGNFETLGKIRAYIRGRVRR